MALMPEILEHQYRVAPCDLGEQVRERGLQRVGQHAVVACRGREFQLQAALQRGYEDTFRQRSGRDVDAVRRQHRRQRGGAALVTCLRKEWSLHEFDGIGQSGWRCTAQGADLRCRGAATQHESAKQDTRQQAGVLCASQIRLPDRVDEREDIGGTDGVGYDEDDENKQDHAQYIAAARLQLPDALVDAGQFAVSEVLHAFPGPCRVNAEGLQYLQSFTRC